MNTRMLLAAVVAVSLPAGALAAGTAGQAAAPDAMPGAAQVGEAAPPGEAPDPHALDLAELDDDDLVGKSVITTAGNDLGTISAVERDDDGNITEVRIEISETLAEIGAEREEITISADSLSETPVREETLVTTVTLAEIEGAPDFLGEGQAAHIDAETPAVDDAARVDEDARTPAEGVQD